MRLVEIRLQAQIRLLRQNMRPSSEDIVAAGIENAAGLKVLATAVEVALYRQSVLRGALRVDSKAPPALSPGVRSGISTGQAFGVPIEILPVDAEQSTGSQRSAVARAGKILRLRAAAGLRVKPLRVRGTLGNDIDHAVDRIRSP